jgi:site-specific recombinase XerD
VFDQIFSLPHVVARYRNGPLAEERSRYLVYCAETKMSVLGLRAIAIHTLVIAKALHLAIRPDELISLTEIEVAADRWIRRANRRFQHRKKRKRGGHLWQNFKSYAVRWLRFLGRLQVPTPRAYDDRIVQFADFMRQERGLSPQTIAYRCRTIQKFFTQVDEVGLRFDTLAVAQVDELLVQNVQSNGYARTTIRTWGSAIRPFFRFAERRGWCRRGMADAIMIPQVYRFERLPMGPSWEDVNRMLAAAQGDRPVEIRDRALLMLLAIYGFRAGEIIALRLEDFDWEQETLRVPCSKSQRPRTYPLCRPVGDAVLRYLQEARPRSERREVFLTFVRPFRPLDSSRVSGVVSQRLRALRVTLAHYGSHALRHACATHLLAQGLSLKEIGDHLGHQSPETTRIYAKVDLAALRLVGNFDLEGLL